MTPLTLGSKTRSLRSLRQVPYVRLRHRIIVVPLGAN